MFILKLYILKVFHCIIYKIENLTSQRGGIKNTGIIVEVIEDNIDNKNS